jgi:hypothetical protein
MKISKFQPDWEVDVITPNCANLAVKEEPVLLVNEVRHRFYLEGKELRVGISSDEMDQEVVKEDLFRDLIDEIKDIVPEEDWPDIDDLDLRWLPGSDRLSAWIDAILMPKD